MCDVLPPKKTNIVKGTEGNELCIVQFAKSRDTQRIHASMLSLMKGIVLLVELDITLCHNLSDYTFVVQLLTKL